MRGRRAPAGGSGKRIDTGRRVRWRCGLWRGGHTGGDRAGGRAGQADDSDELGISSTPLAGWGLIGGNLGRGIGGHPARTAEATRTARGRRRLGSGWAPGRRAGHPGH